jgi:tetratricopeptide (TPR) repeat protein
MRFPRQIRPRLLAPFALALPIIVLSGVPNGLLIGNRAMAAPLPASAQTAAGQISQDGDSPEGKPAALHGRLLLVLPFEDRAEQPNLGWISEAVPEILDRRLSSAGFMPIGRDDRLYALDHLGLPETFQPSRASAIRLAQALDANYLIVGWFSTEGQRFRASAQILNMDSMHLSPPTVEEADISRLLDVLNSLAWRLAKELDPQFAVAEDTFVAADSSLKVATFENYIRGLVEPDADARIAHLKEALRLDPTYGPSLFALGKAYFANQQYEQAATTLGSLSKDDPNAREADFYRGLAYIYLGSYVKAEDAFAFVSGQLPLPEVVNNQGVAASRRDKDGTALFEQAVAADPNDPDYQFNLAVALDRKKDVAGALAAIEKALKLSPQDSEAQAFEATLRAQAQKIGQVNRVSASFGAASDQSVQSDQSSQSKQSEQEEAPLERVKRTFNEASFRQAAFEMEQLEAVRLASLPPARHAAILTNEGTRFLDQGLVLEAEREFQAALQADNGSAGAHAGLAMVRERDGDSAAARQEAEQSLKLQPNITAYLVLAKLDLTAGQLPAAAGSVSHALQLEPQNSIARGLRQQLEAKGQQVP